MLNTQLPLITFVSVCVLILRNIFSVSSLSVKRDVNSSSFHAYFGASEHICGDIWSESNLKRVNVSIKPAQSAESSRTNKWLDHELKLLWF